MIPPLQTTPSRSRPSTVNYALAQHFERLHGHRTGIVEGVRAVAFRNMDHLARVMKRARIDSFTNDTSIAKVQDAMIREQGLEPTPTRRWLLGSGLANAWEVYQCLVLAEVESYRSIRDSFALAQLDALIDRNATALDALKTFRDKLLHPTKDVPYDQTLLRCFREIEGRYPMYFLFVAHLQTLVDQHLRVLKDHLLESMVDDIAHLPDNQLHAFLTRQESDLNRAFAQADNAIDKSSLEESFRRHDEFVRNLRIDSTRKDDPLNKRQRTRVRRLNDLYSMLLTTPLPPTDYHGPEVVQRPIHETLSSYIPVATAPTSEGFYRGAQLPPPFRRTQRDHATLVFRSVLLLSESLHDADTMLATTFPGLSHSEIQKLDDWTTRIPVPTTPEDIAASQRRTSPGIVAFALLADPLRVYRQVISVHPALSVPELNRVATEDFVATLFAWRNTVFHVPDRRIRDVYRLEHRFQEKSPHDYLRDLVSGLWRLFLRGDAWHSNLIGSELRMGQ